MENAATKAREFEIINLSGIYPPCLCHGTCAMNPPREFPGICTFCFKYLAMALVPQLCKPAIPVNRCDGACAWRNASQRSKPKMTGSSPYNCVTVSQVGNILSTSRSMDKPARVRTSTTASRPTIASSQVTAPWRE